MKDPKELIADRKARIATAIDRINELIKEYNDRKQQVDTLATQIRDWRREIAQAESQLILQ